VSLPSPGLVVLAALLVVLAAVSAAGDTALSRVSRARTAELVATRRSGARALAAVVADPASALSIATLLRVVAETGAAVAVSSVSFHSLGVTWRAGLVALLVYAAVSFVAVGVTGRTIGRQHAEAVGLLTAPMVLRLRPLLGPLARSLVLVGNAVTPGRGFRYGPFDSEAELRDLVDLAGESALIEADEREMIHSVFDLGDTLTREVMVPRTDLVVMPRDTLLPEAMTLFLRSGFSRIPVVGHGLDDLLGVVYLKDVASRLHLHRKAGKGETVDRVMRPAVFVPDSKPVDDLLREMQRTSGHVAVVVDEYGGTAGLVTIEDILEEIVGEIADEHDHESPEVERLAEGRYRVQARLHVEDLGELFGIPLEDEEVDTVGGLLAKTIGQVPIEGSQATVAGLRLIAERVEGRRHTLATVLVERDPDAVDPDDPERREPRTEHQMGTTG
jgi:CBS domain containing-hemolysin-like protein